MSTPDNPRTDGEQAPGGVNAWKGGLSAARSAQPSAPAAQADGVVAAKESPPRASATRWTRWFVGALVCAGIAVGVWRPWHRYTAAASAWRNGAASTLAAMPGGAVHAPAYRALAIGINNYAPAAGVGWQPLQSARPDAEAVARVLADEYGFDVRTLLDQQATRGAIMNALDELATGGTDDAVLIYFAGHGYYDEKLKEGYWIPADARRTAASGRDAKEDWLWNSTLTRLFGASSARHVLVLADACYGGALFRGDQPLSERGNHGWYEQAFARRSRYLITSGGLEPVLDSGGAHSVFAQQILNYLSGAGRDIFSANDLALALRERVSALTGQMVQMGPLPVSEHAGGEFVFVRKAAGAQLAAKSAAPAATEAAVRGTFATNEQATLRTALALAQNGAPKAAARLVDDTLKQDGQDRLARTVADYLVRQRDQGSREELRTLIASIEAHGRSRTNAAAAIRPRVLACIGPNVPPALSAADGADLLYRIALRAELAERTAARVVEREALDKLLQEQNLGSSDLADPRVRTALGKLLPASLLLLGDLLPSPSGDRLFLRLVDTETTAVLASFSATRPADGDVGTFCADLATRVADKIVAARPLQAPVQNCAGTRLQAPFGAFQGGRTGLVFSVAARTGNDGAEQEFGSATVRSVTDSTCELDATWSATAPARTDNLWLRERAPIHRIP